MKYSWVKYVGLALNLAIIIILLGFVSVALSIFSESSMTISSSIPLSFTAAIFVLLAILSFGIFVPIEWLRWTLPLIGLFIMLIFTFGTPNFTSGLLAIGFGLEALGVWMTR
jgi:hypothetical protein